MIAKTPSLVCGLCLVLGALTSGCCTTTTTTSKSPPLDLGNKANSGWVAVTGSAEKLEMFDTKLRALMGIGKGDHQFLGCRGCDKLGSTTPPSELGYSFARKPETVFQHFGAAWNEIWFDPKDPFNGKDKVNVQMHFRFINDDDVEGDPLCDNFKPICHYRVNCPSVAYCSKNSTGLCVPQCDKK